MPNGSYVKRNRWRHHAMERLESREYLSYSYVGIRRLTPSEPRAVIGGLYPGQQVKVHATYDAGPNGGGPNSATIKVPGASFVVAISDPEEFVFNASANTAAIDAVFHNAPDLNDFVDLIFHKEDPTDLVPISLSANIGSRTLALRFDIRSKGLDRPAAIGYDWIDAKGTPLGSLALPIGHPATVVGAGPIASAKVHSIEFGLLRNAPSKAVGIRATLDPGNQVHESSDSNSIDYNLANIVALAPRNSSSGLEIGYRVDNAPFINTFGAEPINVRAYWSTTPTWTGREGVEQWLIRAIPMDPGRSKDTYLRIDDDLTNPPPGARYILTRVDNGSYVPESNESDNNASMALFSATISSLNWDGRGGVRVGINVQNRENIPANSNLRIEFVYSSSDSVENAMPGWSYSFPITRGGRSFDNGNNEWTITAANVTPPSTAEIVKFGRTVTHLIAILKQDGAPAFVNAKAQMRPLNLPLVSLELADAPGARTDRERVALWLEKYSDKIYAAARERRIDPRAIAGVIAWEALDSPHGKRTIEDKYVDPRAWFRRGANGPGKIHYDPNTFVGLFGEVHPLVAEEVELLGLMPKQPSAEARRIQVEKPNVAIRYISAIMGAYADAYEVHGFSIRKRPEILATLYNGTDKTPNLTNAFENLPSLPPNYQPGVGDPGYAGQWVARNRAFLRNAIDFNPRNFNPSVVKYIPKFVDVPIPFNSAPLTEMSWSLTELAAGARGVVSFYARSFDGGDAMGMVAVRGDRLVYSLPQPGLPTDTIYYSVQVGKAILYGGRIKMRIDIPKITILNAAADSFSDVRLDWQLSLPADKVQIERRTADTEWRTVAALSGDYRNWSGHDHAEDTEYEYQIKALSQTGLMSPASQPVKVRTPRRDPQTPVNSPNLQSPLDGVQSARRQTPFDWSALSAADSYVLRIFESGAKVREVEVATTSYTLLESEQLKRATAYTWTVAGKNSAGEGPQSAPWAFTTRNTAPENAPALHSPSDGITEARRQTQFDWSGLSAADTYVLRIFEDGTKVRDIEVNTTSYTLTEDEQLKRLTRYTWTVAGKNSAGEGPQSDPRSFKTRNTAPEKAPILQSPSDGATGARRQTQFDWSALSAAETYVLRVFENGNKVREVEVATTSYTLLESEQLKRTTTYTWTVAGKNPVGEGPQSVAWAFTTRNTPPENAPTLLNPAPGATNARLAPTFQWTNLGNADSYVLILYRGTDSNEVRRITVPKGDGDITAYTIPASNELKSATDYWWQVLGVNSAGSGPLSQKARFRTRS